MQAPLGVHGWHRHADTFCGGFPHSRIGRLLGRQSQRPKRKETPMRRTTFTLALLGLISALAFAGQRAAGPVIRNVALPTTRTEEAVDLLKRENFYDSLSAAYQTALYGMEAHRDT